MTNEVYNVLRGKIGDAINGARSAGASLAKSAHEILESAQVEEPAPTALGTSGRADLIDHETVRVLLTGANLSRIDGMLSAYGTVLRILDDARDDERTAAVERVEAEAVRDAEAFKAARSEDPEWSDTPAQWAPGALAAWLDDEGESVIAPLSRDEATAIHLAALLRALGAS